MSVTVESLSDVVLRVLKRLDGPATAYELAWAIDDKEYALGTQGGSPRHFGYPAAQVAAACRNLARKGVVTVTRDGNVRLYEAANSHSRGGE